MGNSCGDVCDEVVRRLNDLGFHMDEESHDEILESLNQCHLVRDEAVVMRWPNPEGELQ